MKKLRRILTVGSLAAFACALSSATTITVNCSLSSGNTELGTGAGGTTNSTINCADFNTMGGSLTLQSIGLVLTGAVISPSSVSATNNDNAVHSGIINDNSNFMLDSSTPLNGFGITNSVLDGVDLINGIFNINAFTTASVGANPNYMTGPLNNPCGLTPACNVGPLAVSGTGSAGGTDTTVFTPYESPSAGSFFNIVADTNTEVVCGISGGNASCGNSTFDSFTAAVTYTYTTTLAPEPATLFLMGSALVGVGMLRKRFKPRA